MLATRGLYEVIEHAPKEGASPTIWAWPQIVDYLKVAGQPVQGLGRPTRSDAPIPMPRRCRELYRIRRDLAAVDGGLRYVSIPLPLRIPLVTRRGHSPARRC